MQPEMQKKNHLKLNRLLSDNRTVPLILAGLTADTFENGIRLPADTDEGALHLSNMFMPPWMKAVEKVASQTGKAVCYLVIDGLDTVSQVEQEKFLPLLKDRRAGLFKLPSNIQIVMPVQNAMSVSQKIKAVSLSWALK